MWNLERGVWYVSVASMVGSEMRVSEKESEPETDEDLENRRSAREDNLADSRSRYPESYLVGGRETTWGREDPAKNRACLSPPKATRKCVYPATPAKHKEHKASQGRDNGV